MAIVFDSANIRGLRATHFEQLMSALQDSEDAGIYYGNKIQYYNRHVEIKEWLQSVIDIARDPDYIIPRG